MPTFIYIAIRRIKSTAARQVLYFLSVMFPSNVSLLRFFICAMFRFISWLYTCDLIVVEASPGITFTQTASFGHGPNMCVWPSLIFSLLFFFFFFYFLLFYFILLWVVSFPLTFSFPSNRAASAALQKWSDRVYNILTWPIFVHHPITFRWVDIISPCVGLYITNGKEREETRTVYDGRWTQPVQSISNNISPFFSCLP